MKPPGPIRHFTFAFLIALVVYVIFYTGIEHRRARNGSWRVAFTNQSGIPVFVINEPRLGISNVVISFPGQSATTNAAIVFDVPQPVPFNVPCGECIFMDTTFQPGTVVFKLFGHEIQLIPRVLTIDKQDYAWQSGATILLTNAVPTAPQ